MAKGRACSIGSSDAQVILGYCYSGSSKYALWADERLAIRPELSDTTIKMLEEGQGYIAKLCEIERD